ncbi:MAG: hypothetical protein ABIH20_04425 [Candidatus Diapherotrites archaeon]
MPRTRGKYDQPAFIKILSAKERLDRNFYYFLEDLARKKPEFKQHLNNITKEFKLGHITTEQSNQMLWQAVTKATKGQTINGKLLGVKLRTLPNQT